MTAIFDLKKLFNASRTEEIQLDDKFFSVTKPTDEEWPRLINDIQNIDSHPENATKMVKERITGWRNVKNGDIVEIDDEEIANQETHFSLDALSMFLSSNPHYIIGLSHSISSIIVKDKSKKEDRKKKQRK